MRLTEKDYTQRAQRFLAKNTKTLLCVKVVMDENQLSYKIIGVALELHRNIGPGLLESAYENALAYDLRNAGMLVQTQAPMPFVYKA